ncbi:MAG: STM3941 family protein [Pseudomonadota bacterium]
MSDTTDAALPYEVPVKTGFLKTIATVSLVMAGLSGLMLVVGEATTPEDMVMAVVGVLFFGIGGFYMRRAVPTFTTAFRATEDGLSVGNQYGTIGPVPWADIREFRMEKTKVKFLSLKSVAVVLQDPEKTLRDKGFMNRLSGMASTWTDSSALGVPVMFIDAPHFVVLDRLNAILKAQKG